MQYYIKHTNQQSKLSVANSLPSSNLMGILIILKTINLVSNKFENWIFPNEIFKKNQKSSGNRNI